MTNADCDYIVVGSGAGGGTLAARLAESGARVLLLEAGGDPRTSGDYRLPEDYDVPAFHAFASENPAMSWDFFVRHYADEARQRRDPKYCSEGPQRTGIFYPRAATLGGCTAHNAMITVYPHDADWDGIAALTGDESWRPARMRKHFQKLEDCRHRPGHRLLRWLGFNPSGHGWRGWLRTERAMPLLAFKDHRLMKLLLQSALAELGSEAHLERSLAALLESHADPNDIRSGCGLGEGLCYTPMATRNHARMGARERVLDVAARYPDRLRVELHALATRVVLDEDQRATGVEYLKGERLYRAHPQASDAIGERHVARASREVILCGGAFNTPQLLMLSGIGPAQALSTHHIPLRVDSPGVGRNLQDRYEVGVINRMNFPAWEVLDGARFDDRDRLHREWSQDRSGMYVSNGAALALARRSSPERASPDLFCMALLANFRGYFPGYSKLIAEHQNYLSWAILKAHTHNRNGEVKLRSADPRDTPEIDFHYFNGAGANEDLKSVIEGIRLVRRIAASQHAEGLIAEEELPGMHLQSDEELGAFVRNNAWGHHACGSCAIGPRESHGVLDSRFRVHGTRDLRVVDASIFPRIPGFFIASAVYMIGEKAAEVILQDRK